MLVFIGLILVYGILFAILAVSKAILDKDKKPPASKSNHTQSNSKKPAYSVKVVPEQRRSTVDEDAWILLQSRTKPTPPPARRSSKPVSKPARSFMTQTVNVRIARNLRMIKSGAGILEGKRGVAMLPLSFVVLM